MRQGPEEHRESGQIAYDKWRYLKGGYDHGIWLPPWEEVLDERILDFWRDIAHEVIRKAWVESAPPPPWWRRKKEKKDGKVPPR